MDLYSCELPHVEKLNRKAIGEMVSGYMQRDRQAGREWSLGYVDVEWVVQQSDAHKHKCGVCKEVMNLTNKPQSPLNYTVDRIDNSLPHLKFNCCLMCHNCNISKH
jgi:hypothetical protein